LEAKDYCKGLKGESYLFLLRFITQNTVNMQRKDRNVVDAFIYKNILIWKNR